MIIGPAQGDRVFTCKRVGDHADRADAPISRPDAAIRFPAPKEPPELFLKSVSRRYLCPICVNTVWAT